MTTGNTTSKPRGHLSLVVERPRTALIAKTPSASLTATPFRPGEMPLISWLPLDVGTRATITEEARRAGLPPELWVRIGVEAARIVDEIVSITGCDPEWLIEQIDERAGTVSVTEDDVLALEGVGLLRYAAHLEATHPAAAVQPDFPLRLPEEMTGRWRASARAAGLSMPAWVSGRLARVPERCVMWETASARKCQTMAEWAYAVALAEIARASAAAHER